MIYFIQAGHTGLIKIGKSDNPVTRLAAGQTFSAQRLRLLGVIDEGRYSEPELHKRFVDTRAYGEWFIASRALKKFIELESEPQPNINFYDWLVMQRDCDDYVGDLASDVCLDEDLNHYAPPKTNSAWQWFKFLRQRVGVNRADVIDSFIGAYKEWQKVAACQPLHSNSAINNY